MEKSKDIGLVVATKREAMWIEIRDNAKENLKKLETQLAISTEILKRAEEIIKEEHAH